MTPSTAFVLFLPVLVLVVAGPMLFGGWRIAYAVDHLEPFTNKWCKATYNETRLKNEFHSTEYRNRPIDCVVRGESPSESSNPAYCTAFRYAPDGTLYGGLDEKKPCCWTATNNSKVPKELSGIVSVAMDGTITIDYDATRAANVLVPLLSPHKDKIVFNVSWFQLFEPNACYKSCFHDPYTSKRDLRDWLQVTDVDMNIRQSEFLAIMSELSVTFAYSRHPNPQDSGCQLCRNSFTAMVGEDNHDPTTMVVNTTTQHMHYTVPKAPLFEYDTPLNGRACKLDNGLRQWISEDGETGTFYLPFRVMRSERVSGATPEAVEKHTTVPYAATEGIYGRNRCPIKLIFGNDYKLLVPEKLAKG